jgi:hypothetical protein
MANVYGFLLLTIRTVCNFEAAELGLWGKFRTGLLGVILYFRGRTYVKFS